MKKNQPLIIVILILSSLLLSACEMIPFIDIVRGSGNVITETREVGNFNEIRLNGAGRLLITQGAAESLEIRAEDNIIQKLTSQVQDSTLVLGFPELSWRSNIIPLRPIIYTLTVTDLAGLTINGAADIDIESFETHSLAITINGAGQAKINTLTVDNLEVLIAGAGNVELAGEATNQSIKIEGAGNYQAGEFRTATTDISIDGLGNATVWSTDRLAVSISGAGNLEYYGTADITQNVSGAGNIQYLGEK